MTKKQTIARIVVQGCILRGDNMRYFKIYEISRDEFIDQAKVDISDKYAQFCTPMINENVYIAVNENEQTRLSIPLTMFDGED